MKPQTLSGFEKYGKTTRRTQFLSDMDRIVPWVEPSEAVESAHPKESVAGGRPPIPLYDSVTMRSLVGFDFGEEVALDEFRHLVEKNKLCRNMLAAVKE